MRAENTLAGAVGRYRYVLVGTKSTGTVTTYMLRLRWLQNHLSDGHLLDAITLADLELALATYRNGRKNNTTALAVTAWRRFFTWSHRVGLLSTNPALYLDSPRRTVADPRPLDERVVELLRSLMRADTTSEEWIIARNATLVLTLVYTGIRRDEAAGLAWPAVDLDGRTIRVVGKGDKPRVVPIPLVLLPHLKRFAEASQRDYGAVFGKEDGTRLHTYTINAIFVRWVSERLGKRITPHILRHTYATRLYETGASLEDVGEILGHTSIRTTKIYVRRRMDRYIKAADKLT